MDGSFVSIIEFLVSAGVSFLIAWRTAHWQIRLRDKENASDRRFALYDEAARMIVELEDNPSLSLEDDYLKRFRNMAGTIKVYAPKNVVEAITEYAGILKDNRVDYDKAREALRNQWCEGEHVVSDDGVFSDIDYRLVAGEPWEYKEALEELRRQSQLSTDIIRAAGGKAVKAMREDASVDWAKR